MTRRVAPIFGSALIGGARAGNSGREHDQALRMDQRLPPWPRTSPGVNSIAPGATSARAGAVAECWQVATPAALLRPRVRSGAGHRGVGRHPRGWNARAAEALARRSG